MTTTMERFNRQELMQPGALDQMAQRRYGMPAKMLEGHLQLLGQVAGGRVTPQAKRWLIERARESGVPAERVESELRTILALPTPQERQARYVAAADGDPTLVQQAVELAASYQTNRAVDTVERRLTRNDQRQKQWQSFGFEDREEFKASREEAADGTRGAIKRAMVSSGLMAPKARTLQEAQLRAQSFANAVANRLEARTREDKEPSLRETVEDAYLTDQALAAKRDAGITTDTIGSVAEATDAARSFVESAWEPGEE